MVAEVRRGETTRAWIWQPETGHAYVAEFGAGLYCSGERVGRGRGINARMTSSLADRWSPKANPGVAAPLPTKLRLHAQLGDGEVDFFTI